MEFVSKLKLDMERLDREYEAKGVTTWTAFKADPAAHQKKVIELTAADFAQGTLRIKFPCKLKLMGDIQFNPNRGALLPNGKIDPTRTLDWFPSRTVASNIDPVFGYYAGDVAQAYGIGFFAAIAVEAEGVVIDLNNYNIAIHKEFAVMQQFFATIELGDQPFPVNSGPVNFGSDLRRAKKVWIKNGILGYSSHHNLHANDAQEVLVTNVVMKDSTVAGVSMNGTKKLALIDCEFKGHRTDVTVRGAFNEVRLQQKLIEGYKASKIAAGQTISAELQASYDAGKLVVEKVFNDIILTGAIRGHDAADSTTLSAEDVTVLKNMTGLSDAIAYGFVLNAADNATGKFLETRDLKGNEAAEIALVRCNIEKTVSAPIEILAMSPAIVESQEIEAAGEVLYSVDAQMRGTTGAVLDFVNAFDYSGTAESNPNYGKWVGNIVANMQVELAAAQTAEADAAKKAMLGQINIEPKFIEMKRGEGDAVDYRFLPIAIAEPEAAAEGDKVYLLVDGHTPTDLVEAAATPFGHAVADATRGLEELEFVVLAQGDIQHHVLKGNLGLRLEGASDVTLEHVTVTGVDNQGGLGYGYTAFAQEMGYIGDADGGHGGQGGMPGYFGNHARGVSIAGCTGLKIKDLKVSGIKSSTGPAWGLEVKGETTDAKLEQIEVKGVAVASAMTKPQVKALKKYPNWQPKSVGVRVDSSVSYIEIKGLKVSSLSQPVESGKELEIESASVKVI